jgi:hypothetical protein
LAVVGWEEQAQGLLIRAAAEAIPFSTQSRLLVVVVLQTQKAQPQVVAAPVRARLVPQPRERVGQVIPQAQALHRVQTGAIAALAGLIMELLGAVALAHPDQTARLRLAAMAATEQRRHYPAHQSPTLVGAAAVHTMAEPWD